jgi:hypothetical protein
MKKYLISSGLFVLSAESLWACDSCGCEFCEPSGLFSNLVFGANATVPAQSSYFFADVVEQYTDFGTLKNVPAGVSTNQWENSFITQFIFGYQINPDLNVQLNVPYIYRNYQIENLGGALTRGQVNGLGDIRLILNYTAFRKETADSDFSWRVSGGVKLPTGDDHLLAQEDPGAAPSDLNGPASAVGGHDLALGSGSVDGIVATGITYNQGRFLFTADADYTIRSTGYAGYRYSNELGWSGGPGYRVWQDANHALSLQFLASGEYKAADTVQGSGTNDTFVSSVLLGPNVIFAWNKVLTAHFQAEIPVMLHYDDGFQAIPTFRLKAGVTFSF